MNLKIKALTAIAALISLAACNNADVAKDNGMGEFLPVEKAFKLTVSKNTNDSLQAHWEIEDGYHLYKNKLKFSLANSDYQIKNLIIPEGHMLDDEIFGKTETFDKSLDVVVELKTLNATGQISLETGYQGCATKGLCYPPQTVVSIIKL